MIILGVKVKFLNNEEYCVNVWLDYSEIVINSVISVEDGNENLTGIVTA